MSLSLESASDSLPAIPHRKPKDSLARRQDLPGSANSKAKTKQIDFQFDQRDLQGLEQNPDTKSRWAKMARDGKKVMQFLERGEYVAVVADGKVGFYPG